MKTKLFVYLRFIIIVNKCATRANVTLLVFDDSWYYEEEFKTTQWFVWKYTFYLQINFKFEVNFLFGWIRILNFKFNSNLRGIKNKCDT